MVNIERLNRALIAADAAGNEEDARAIAAEITKLRGIQESEGFSLLKTMENIPGSAAGVMSDTANAVMHPFDTAKAVGNLALGGVQKLIPGEQSSEQYADAFGSFIKDRYGSGDAIMQTIQNDPVGFLGDLSSFIMPAGAAARAIPGLGKIGSAAQNTGALLEPFNMIKMGVSKGIPSGVPGKLYESAAKFSTTLTPDQRSALINTGLERGLSPTRAGVNKAQDVLTGLENQIDELVKQADETGNLIPKERLFRYLRESRDRFGGVRLEASDDLSRIDQVAKAFDEHLKGMDKDMLTPSEVQGFKKAVYSRINYDKQASRTREATEHAQKGMARAAKEEMEVLSPELKDVNQQYGDVRQWMDAGERSAGRIENRDLIGIGVPIKTMAGEAAMGGGGAIAGALHGLIDSPRLKSMVAIKLKEMKDAGITLTPAVISQVLYQTGRYEGMLDQP